MKTVSDTAAQQADIIEGKVRAPEPSADTESGTARALPEPNYQTLDFLFARMVWRFGAKFSSTYDEDPLNKETGKITGAALTWWESIHDLSFEDLRHGMERAAMLPPNAKGEVWPPNPPEFRALCQSVHTEALPPVDRAYREACEHSTRPAEHDWSHPAVFVAGQDAGWWSLRRDPSRTTWPVFRRSYEDACNRVKAGEDLSAQVVKALPETPAEVTPADRDTALSKLDEMRAALRRRKTEEAEA